MPLPASIKEISVGPLFLQLCLDGQTPLVSVNGHYYNHIWLLNQAVPLLSNPIYIKQFAEASNFLWKGLEYQYIENIARYQQFYNDQIELEKKFPGDVFPYRLTDYKIFDVSVMHDPCLKGGMLHYYVYQTATGLPYRVICPFPYPNESASTLVHYQILPLKTEVSHS